MVDMMSVLVKVWPSDSPSFVVEWRMPALALDDKGMTAVLESVLRQNSMDSRECVAELSTDGRVIVSIDQRIRLTRRKRLYPGT